MLEPGATAPPGVAGARIGAKVAVGAGPFIAATPIPDPRPGIVPLGGTAAQPELPWPRFMR